MQISSLSLEYVRVPVSTTLNGVVIDPTADSVQMAFPALNVDPVAGDWEGASWETDSAASPPVYYARCLVGPSGTVTLAAGLWSVYVRVTDNPEVPVRNAGTLQVV